MSSSNPRKHHVVPAFYLAGFTRNGLQTGTLHVFDYSTGKRYRSTPRTACRETDFYRIEEPGVDPNQIERLMAWHEGVVAPFVQSIASSGSVTDRRQIGETLALAALLAVRSRRGRRQLEVVLAGKLAKAMRRGEVSPKQWEHLRAADLRNGATDEDVPPYEEARERLQRGEWFPRTPTVLTVGLIPEAQDAFLKMLQRRHWELLVTDSSTNGGFISSDSPLAWGDLAEIAAGRQQRIENYDIEITFPVGRNAALASYPDARDAICEGTDEIVAHINMRTLQLSPGLVFHCDEDFLLRRSSGQIAQSSDYFSYVSEARRRGFLRP